MSNDTISDMLTRIRNAILVFKKSVRVNKTQTNIQICKILKKRGFITRFYESNTKKTDLIIVLKYYSLEESPKIKKPCITNLKRISKPGLRVYSSYKKIPKLLDGLGFFIISTSKGLITDDDARFFEIGGEILCCIW